MDSRPAPQERLHTVIGKIKERNALIEEKNSLQIRKNNLRSTSFAADDPKGSDPNYNPREIEYKIIKLEKDIDQIGWIINQEHIAVMNNKELLAYLSFIQKHEDKEILLRSDANPIIISFNALINKELSSDEKSALGNVCGEIDISKEDLRNACLAGLDMRKATLPSWGKMPEGEDIRDLQLTADQLCKIYFSNDANYHIDLTPYQYFLRNIQLFKLSPEESQKLSNIIDKTILSHLKTMECRFAKDGRGYIMFQEQRPQVVAEFEKLAQPKKRHRQPQPLPTVDTTLPFRFNEAGIDKKPPNYATQVTLICADNFKQWFSSFAPKQSLILVNNLCIFMNDANTMSINSGAGTPGIQIVKQSDGSFMAWNNLAADQGADQGIKNVFLKNMLDKLQKEPGFCPSKSKVIAENKERAPSPSRR